MNVSQAARKRDEVILRLDRENTQLMDTIEAIQDELETYKELKLRNFSSKR
jgi:hypothetical protein